MDHLDPIVLAVPCVASCLHVPPRCRAERLTDVATTAQVRIRQGRRADFAVSAALLSATGRNRSDVLTDGTAHYAPMALNIGKPLDIRALSLTLANPEIAHRLNLPRIGIHPATLSFEALPTRRIVDDGLQAARIDAQALADDWLVVGGIVHQRVRPPCQVVRFAYEDHRGRFHVEPHVGRAPLFASIYIRLSPGEDPEPYAAALARSGRERTLAKTRRIAPGEVPVRFGAEELLDDLLACVPLLLSSSGLAHRPSADIRAHARLGTLLRRREGSPRDDAAGIAGAFADLAHTKADRSAAALYAERLAALA